MRYLVGWFSDYADAARTCDLEEPKYMMFSDYADAARTPHLAERVHATNGNEGSRTMPRVLVTTDDYRPGGVGQVLVNEQVDLVDLASEQSSEQLIERLAWGIEDAARAETAFRDALRPRPRSEVGGY